MTESSNGLEGASGFIIESVSVTRHVTKVTVAKAEFRAGPQGRNAFQCNIENSWQGFYEIKQKLNQNLQDPIPVPQQ